MSCSRSKFLLTVLSLLFVVGCSKKATDIEKMLLPSGSGVILYETFPDLLVFSFLQGKVLENPGWFFSHVSTEEDSLFNPSEGDLWHDDFYMIVRQGVESFVDMGFISLDEITQAPASGYQVSCQAKTNHAYVLITSSSKYAKIKIREVNANADYIKFDWVYQPDGGRNF